MPLDVADATIDSPIGPLAGRFCDAGWIELRFPEPDRLRLPGSPFDPAVAVALADSSGPGRNSPRIRMHLDAMRAFLVDLFSGRQPARLPEIGLRGGTPFETAIRREMQSLGFGMTTTYGELAAKAGRPGAARAAGGIMKRNPLPLLIPCHRVLAAGGGIGGFTPGLELKRWLLRLEAAGFAAATAPPRANQMLLKI
jgi:methylated-DNA-[protein]-cysteine S-methyltransferase